MKLQTMTVPQVLIDDGNYHGPLCIHVSPYKGRTLVRLSRCHVVDGKPQPGGVGTSFDVNDFGTFYTALNAFMNAQRGAKPKAA